MRFDPNRYENMRYRRCGHSGLQLPAVALGMWHNFGARADHDNCRAMMRKAFDLGITYFDLADAYGPEAGSAEERVGRILKKDFSGHRDELVVATKAGFPVWDGPYGDWASRKHLIASLDQSLQRLGLDYVDIFYSHRADPDTPLEETLGALDQIVRQGKALYVGVSNYWGTHYVRAEELVLQRGFAPITMNQAVYNLFSRRAETDLMPDATRYGTGLVIYSPLMQGLLTNKYLDPDNPIPRDSRAADPEGFLSESAVTEERVETVRQANELACKRGQSMVQMALAWTLRRREVASAIIGARTPGQIEECAAAVNNLDFSAAELERLDSLFAPPDSASVPRK